MASWFFCLYGATFSLCNRWALSCKCRNSPTSHHPSIASAHSLIENIQLQHHQFRFFITGFRRHSKFSRPKSRLFFVPFTVLQKRGPVLNGVFLAGVLQAEHGDRLRKAAGHGTLRGLQRLPRQRARPDASAGHASRITTCSRRPRRRTAMTSGSCTRRATHLYTTADRIIMYDQVWQAHQDSIDWPQDSTMTRRIQFWDIGFPQRFW